MKQAEKPILVSGIKPTGSIHIGNYFGAMKQFVDLQDSYTSFIFIADLHALNTLKDPEKLREYTLELALAYLAVGLDPQKVIFFKQSDIAAHSELCWIFNTLTTMPYLMRAHAFKDAEAKNKDINVGTFDYPMLMAADILLYDADIVPVGLDQKQHIEFARDTAQKFNQLFGEVFKLPEPLLQKNVQTVPGIDGNKMSKSYNNIIPLFASTEEVEKIIFSIPTDSRGLNEAKDIDNSILFKIHSLFLSEGQQHALRQKYEGGGVGYKELKESLIEDIEYRLKPLRERRLELLKNKDIVLDVLTLGADIAREKANKKLATIKKYVGLLS